jgi:anti-anti-sigma factor
MENIMDSFTYNITNTGGYGIIEIKGNISPINHGKFEHIFKDAVENKGIHFLIVDLSAIHFVSSFIVATIGYYFKALNNQGGYLALVLDNKKLLKPFELAGLVDILPIFPTTDEAVAAMKTQVFGWSKDD